jgi:hypothetical protein
MNGKNCFLLCIIITLNAAGPFAMWNLRELVLSPCLVDFFKPPVAESSSSEYHSWTLLHVAVNRRLTSFHWQICRLELVEFLSTGGFSLASCSSVSSTHNRECAKCRRCNTLHVQVWWTGGEAARRTQWLVDMFMCCVLLYAYNYRLCICQEPSNLVREFGTLRYAAVTLVDECIFRDIY